MARKAFFLLWMTIWPIVALLPALTTAPTAGGHQANVTTPVVLAQNLSEESKAPIEITETLPHADDATIPQRAAPGLVAGQTPQLHEPESLDPTSQPVSVATDGADVSAKGTTRENLPSTSSRKGDSTRPSATVPHSIRRTSPTLTAQEEHARKLIYERAQLRAQQRHARLNVKYHRENGIAPLSTGARWQVQLTQPNWIVGSRSSRRP